MPRLAAPYYPEETPQSLFALAKDHPHGSTKRLFFAASVVGLSCWPQLLASVVGFRQGNRGDPIQPFFLRSIVEIVAVALLHRSSGGIS